MHFSKGTKYIAANIAIVMLALVVFEFYTHARGQAGDPGMLMGGIMLYLLVGAAIVFRAYYRKQRFQFLDKTPQETALKAEGLLGADRLKNITLKLHVSEADFHTFLASGQLAVRPEVFEKPIRHGDTIQVYTGNAERSGYAPARITNIDGYNQKVTIELNRSAR